MCGRVTGDVDVVGAFDVTGAASVTGGDVVLDGSHCVVAPCIPTLGDHLTNKTYVDTEISGIVAEGGGTGIVISDTPPEDTEHRAGLDSSDESVATPDTVIVFTYIDETDARPEASVVFWIPDPYTLDDPFGVCSKATSSCVPPPTWCKGVNGITGLWQGTAAEYEALPTHDATTVYFIIPT